MLTAVVAAVALLTNLPPGDRPGVPVSVPTGGPPPWRCATAGEISIWPGLAGPNASGCRCPARRHRRGCSGRWQDGVGGADRAADVAGVGERPVIRSGAGSGNERGGTSRRPRSVWARRCAAGVCLRSRSQLGRLRRGRRRTWRWQHNGWAGIGSGSRCWRRTGRRHASLPSRQRSAGDAMPKDGGRVLRGAGQAGRGSAGGDGAAARAGVRSKTVLALPAADAPRATGLVRDTATVAAGASVGADRERPGVGSGAFGAHDVHRELAGPAVDRRARRNAVTTDRRAPI